MSDKKTTSRIIREMGEIMRGLHQSGVLTRKEFESFMHATKERAKQVKSFDQINSDKS